MYIEKLEQVDDVVQESILALTDIHDSIDRKSKLEVFFDDPVVRDLLQDMTNARTVVDRISRTLDDVVLPQGEAEDLSEERQSSS